jgi:hypothetical protein
MVTLSFSEAIRGGLEQERAKACELNNLRLYKTVTHLPTGASKWNPIEHRLFSQISRNWAGEPLVSYETILKFIRTTRTESGLRCKAYLDKTIYETKLQLTPEQKERINMVPRRVLPKYNYTIKPHV